TVPVHLRFDPSEDAFPEVHALKLEFPQFFPQVWKTLGRDQTRMESLRRKAPEKDADCSTQSANIGGSIYLERVPWLREFGPFNRIRVIASGRMGFSSG